MPLLSAIQIPSSSFTAFNDQCLVQHKQDSVAHQHRILLFEAIVNQQQLKIKWLTHRGQCSKLFYTMISTKKV